MIKYLFIAALFVTNYSYANSEASECSKIKSDSKRLFCYDLIFKELKRVGFDSWISIEDCVDGFDQLERSVNFVNKKILEYWK